MSILSDNGILTYIKNGSLLIDPFDIKCLQPASYDFHLHEGILVPRVPEVGYIVEPDHTDGVSFWRPAVLPKVIYPGEVILGRSVERFGFPASLVGRLEGVSTLGRWFLLVHVTAGFFDPVFRGTATIEIKNLGPFKIMLRPGMRIGQMAFEQTSSPSTRVYGARNRYLGQESATPPRRSPDAKSDHHSD